MAEKSTDITKQREEANASEWKFSRRYVGGKLIAVLLETLGRPVPHNDPVIFAVREDWLEIFRGRELALPLRIIEQAAVLHAGAAQVMQTVSSLGSDESHAKTAAVLEDSEGLQILKAALAKIGAPAAVQLSHTDAHKEIAGCIRECLGAMASMAEQIEQMKGMFDDEDGAIEDALEDYADAEMRARAVLRTVERGGPAVSEAPPAEDERQGLAP